MVVESSTLESSVVTFWEDGPSEVIVVLFADCRLVVGNIGVKGDVDLKVDGFMVVFMVVDVVAVVDVVVCAGAYVLVVVDGVQL